MMYLARLKLLNDSSTSRKVISHFRNFGNVQNSEMGNYLRPCSQLIYRIFDREFNIFLYN